jgi:phosphate transport system substrate-binding protein
MSSTGYHWRVAASLLVLLSGAAIAQEGGSSAEPAVFRSPAPPYSPDAPVKGTIRIVGSDTMQPVAEMWLRGLSRYHPEAKFELDCRGSETALPVLAKSESIIGLMSRPLSEDELKQLKDAGARPVALVVGQDALAIIVHPDNPLREISREGLQKVFATGRTAAAPVWGDLGLSADWAKVPVVPQGRDPESVARRYLRNWVLDAHQKERECAEHLTHAQVAGAVASAKGAIGYVTRTCIGDKVKLVPLRLDESSPAVAPSDEAIARGQYPLVRELYVVINHSEDKPAGALALEVVRYALSRNGQADVLKDGFLPLARPDLNAQFDKLGWNSDK